MADKRTPPPHYAIVEAPEKANTDHVKRKYLDLPYASLSEAQKCDIYLPDEGQGPFPVIVAIHGGAFMGCDKADLQVLPMLEGLARGYAVVSINYRLSWEARFPALVNDAKAAVRWIRANAAQYHLDAEKIACWGGSAGGYLSHMLAITVGILELEDLTLGNPEQSCEVQAAVVWFGPTNFLKMDEQLAANGLLPPPGFRHSEANSPESLLLGGLITENPEQVKAANPETYIRPGGLPILIQHGTKDPVVPVQQSIEIAKRLEEAWGKDQVTLELLEGAEHADVRFEAPENVTRVLDFLDRHLKNVH